MNIGRNAPSRRLFALTTASGIAMSMALAAPAFAQEADSDDEDEVTESTATGNEIIVSGFRASLENAQNIKRDSDTFVDAVTAEDIGALPDRSVAETLQRIPGVNIGRFEGVDDPDRFSVEGTGVIIPRMRNRMGIFRMSRMALLMFSAALDVAFPHRGQSFCSALD